MDVRAFLRGIRTDPAYAGQMVHVRTVPDQPPIYAQPDIPLSPVSQVVLRHLGIDRLYCHQAEALDRVRRGENVLLVTGTASGKSLCYQLPVLEALASNPSARALLLFPTKALCQDQFAAFERALRAAGLDSVAAGVYDGDAPASVRRKLRQEGAIIFTNPDMLHAGMMPHHARWAGFLAGMQFVVIDELHVYNGIFGANMANLLRRLARVCAHYGSQPRVVACSATVGNPRELAETLIGRKVSVVDRDGSPRGARTYVFWNPPRERAGAWRSRRSANVEAHELMARLIERGVPTIVFSKAKMTAEMIHRYVVESLRRNAPHLADRVSPYRGGYLPEERREIERRLFGGELMGVSSTAALELGIDVGGLDASIIVGYPGTVASFHQQAGRAGRRGHESLVVLVGLDTPANQYAMHHPEYVLDRPVERVVVDADNPMAILGHLRCAAQELPIADAEAELFGPHARMVLRVLEENKKVARIDGHWYHASAELPQHELPMRSYDSSTVTIEDADTGAVLGEVCRFDAQPILHPEAIYMHRGETYRVLELDLEKDIARVKREEVDYYTQPVGGTDVHHIDHALREKPFGTGRAYWGEVTACFRNFAYEVIRFYELDAVSRHPLDLPTWLLDTMAFWLVPPEDLMVAVRSAGLDPMQGLRGIGYATRMLLPLFITCDTLSFSHSVGCINSPWNAVFVYERYPLGLGFTLNAYERLHEIMPAVLDAVRKCPCDDGCPCCVGKPLRQFTTWNVERGEGSIPSKRAALMVLEGLLADGGNLQAPEANAIAETEEMRAMVLEAAVRRRLERMGEPNALHRIDPKPKTGYPAVLPQEELMEPDVTRRFRSRLELQRELRKRVAQRAGGSSERPMVQPKPTMPAGPPATDRQAPQPAPPGDVITLGDPLAAKARKLKTNKPDGA